MFNSLISLSHLCLVQVISHLSFIFLLKYNLQVEKLIKNSLIWGEQTSKCWVIRNSVACLSSTHLCVCVCLYVFVFFVPYSKKPVMVLNKIVILEDFLHPVLVLSFFCPPPPPFLWGISLHFGHLNLNFSRIFFYDLLFTYDSLHLFL